MKRWVLVKSIWWRRAVRHSLATYQTQSTWQLTKGASYFHYCSNETIHGVQMFDVPKVDTPIVADMSSCILSESISVDKFGLIYAGAQKISVQQD